jgi:hypothetical protein
MFIFLGDSQPLGYEIGEEINQNSDHIPQHLREKVYHPWAINHECRPDYAYPHILSESLSHDYVNLAIGGTSHLRHLYLFQSYLKTNHVPIGSTVFLNSNNKLRGFFVDNFTCETMDFMDHVYFKSGSPKPGPHSTWQTFLEDPSNSNIVDAITRMFPYYNYQIGLLCESLDLNFLYFPIIPNALDDPEETYEYLNLKPNQIIERFPQVLMSRPNGENELGAPNWLKCHPSRAGHKIIADHIREVYLERNLDKNI